MSVRFIANLRSQLRKPVLKNDGAAIVGGILPMLVGTALDLQGWQGWAISYGSVALIAKGLNHDNIARGALAVAAAHLGWTVATPYFEQVFGRGPWRMGTGVGVSNSVTQMSNSVVSMQDDIEAGQTVAQLPSGAKVYPSSEMSNSVTQMSNSVVQMSGLNPTGPRMMGR